MKTIQSTFRPIVITLLAGAFILPPSSEAQSYPSPGESDDLLANSVQTGIQPGCNNTSPNKYSKPCVGGDVTQPFTPAGSVSPSTGVNPVNAASSSVQRTVHDLVANGGVGGHRLHLTRYGQSRFVSGKQWFGDGHVWRHTYQWEMSFFSTAGADDTVTITQPEGDTFNYVLNNGVGVSTATDEDTFTYTVVSPQLTKYTLTRLGVTQK